MGTKIGWVLTGLIGGLISPTQVALSFSRDSRSRTDSHLPLFGSDGGNRSFNVAGMRYLLAASSGSCHGDLFICHSSTFDCRLNRFIFI
jgi:hypothetical protein